MLRDLLNGQAGNPRAGQHYRTVRRGDQLVHDYAHGPDVAVAQAQQEHQPLGENAGPMQNQGDFHGATSLAGLLRGASIHDQSSQEAHARDMIVNQPGPANQGIHTAQTGPRAGQDFVGLQIGGRKFHVFFSPDGQKQVIELKEHPQPHYDLRG
jgi:hypothetical protein